jgi:hypothetical protein
MRRLIVAALAALAFASPALAQSASPPVATKSQVLPVSPFINYTNGFFVGLGPSAGLAASNVSGNIITLPGLTGGALNAAGGAIDVDFGYVWGHCFLNSWCQIEADFSYQNISGGNAVGTVSSNWILTQEADFGIDILQTVLSYLPGVQNPFPSFSPTGLLPANIAVAATPRGYVGFKQAELLVSGNVGAAGGQTWEYAPGVTTGYRWQTLNSAGKPNGASIKIFADAFWADKGVSISNLFGAGGAPIVTAPKAGMDTLYRFGVHVDFGI